MSLMKNQMNVPGNGKGCGWMKVEKEGSMGHRGAYRHISRFSCSCSVSTIDVFVLLFCFD